MNPPTSPFALGRMRHLDLLTIWHQLHPDSHEHDSRLIAGTSKETIAAAILTSAPHP